MTEAEQQNPTLKIVLIGDMSVGKTHLLNRYLKDSIPKSIQSTIVVEFATINFSITTKEGKQIQFWDTAGQERYKAITVGHFKRAIGAILVYDITKESSFENIQKWLDDIKINCEPSVQTMLIGNKCDLENKRQVETQQAEKFAQENGLLFMETSAITNQNRCVNKAIETLIESIHQQFEERDKPNKKIEEVIVINNQTNSTQCSCFN